MEQNTDIRVQCSNPECGVTLRLPYTPDIEKKTIICPKCKTRAPFSQYRRLAPRDVEVKKPTPPTPPPLPPDVPVGARGPRGHLEEVLTKHRHDLIEGDNMVGRMAVTSGARIKLPSPGNRMSREHMIIKVTPMPGGTHRYTAELAKPKVNTTSINGLAMQYGSSVELHNGDLIALPGMQLRFKI